MTHAHGPRRFKRGGERGSVIVMVSLLMTSLIGMGAIVLDLATLRQDRTKDRATADLIASAAATNKANPNMTMITACTTAWEYFLENTRDSGTVTQVPTCSTKFAGSCSPTVARTMTAKTGPYTLKITNPVPDGDVLMTNPDVVGGTTQAANTDVDGPPCERIGVTLMREREHLFARALGVYEGSTTSRSVARSLARFSVGGVIALLLLDPDACNVLTASGQAQVVIHPYFDKPGYITIDSSATGGSGDNSCTSGTRYAVDALGTQNSQIIAEASSTSGAPGIIRQFALAPGQGNARAYEAADVTAARVSPRPTVASQKITRNPVDWRYNCKQNGRDNIAGNADDCRDWDIRPPYVSNLVAQVGGTGTPTGYDIFPRPGHSEDKCTYQPSDGPQEIPAGNWFVDCPSGFSVSNSVRFVDGNVVFAGGVSVNSSGSLEINQSGNQDGIVYLRSGNFTKGAQSTVVLERAFVYLHNGVLDFGGGAGPLTWIAPTGGNFADLALWSESSALHNLGGQANITVEGVFFAPNAEPFRFTGQGGQNQTNAQFIVKRLDVAGQGTLEMQPNPDRVVILPAWGAALIR